MVGRREKLKMRKLAQLKPKKKVKKTTAPKAEKKKAKGE